MLSVFGTGLLAARQSVRAGYKSAEKPWVTGLKCLHAAPILVLRNWEAGWQRRIPPRMPRHRLCYCVHTSPWHGCSHWNGPTRPCHRMMTYLPFHPAECAWASFHLSLSHIRHLQPSCFQLWFKSGIKRGLGFFFCHFQTVPQLWLKARPQRWGSVIDTPMTLPGSPLGHGSALAPPGGNGGRKNAEGGSELPSGTLRDGEAERWTDDNGREAGAWESPRGDTYTLLCLGSGCCAKCTEPRSSPPCIFLARRSPSWPPLPLHISSSSPRPSRLTPSLFFLSSLTPNQEVMSWRRGCRQVWERYLGHYRLASILAAFSFCTQFLLIGRTPS